VPTAVDLALVFPPGWYYTSVPADLSYPVGALRSRGLRVRAFDLNAGLSHALLGESAGYAALQRWPTYEEPELHRRSVGDLEATCLRIGIAHGVDYHLRHLRFPGIDPFHLPSLRAASLDERRNPALPFLVRAADEIIALRPAVIAIAAIHPEQLAQVAALGRLLRDKGARRLLLYGALEDVLGPGDFAEDLIGDPPHLLFEDFDAVITGEAETALAEFAARPDDDRALIPNLLRRGAAELPPAHIEPAPSLPAPEFDWVRPEHYPTPEPVIDLRLSRGCAWGRCTFCAIHAHQGDYRTQTNEAVLTGMRRARRAVGATFFRLRDELLTPAQIAALGGATPQLDFQPRFAARARIQESLNETTLSAGAAGGLEELWIGLESAVPAIRERMRKGASESDVVALLAAAGRTGVRIRALCLLGFPGETETEAWTTIRFLADHAERLAGASLTPFQLMRRSPMGRAPASFDIEVAPFAHPRWERLTPLLPIRRAPGMPAAQVAALYDEAVAFLLPRFGARNPGPDLAHSWLAASVQRRGLTAAAAGIA